MVITLQQLIDDPKLLDGLRLNATKCCKCKRPEEAFEELWHKTSEGLMCDDCYFDEMGKEIEKHPVGGHRRDGKIKMQYGV